MSKNGNRPAFAAAGVLPNLKELWVQGGVTKRELFAAMAMQGILATDVSQHGDRLNRAQIEEGVANASVAIADALLAALEQKPEGGA